MPLRLAWRRDQRGQPGGHRHGGDRAERCALSGLSAYADRLTLMDAPWPENPTVALVRPPVGQPDRLHPGQPMATSNARRPDRHPGERPRQNRTSHVLASHMDQSYYFCSDVTFGGSHLHLGRLLDGRLQADVKVRAGSTAITGWAVTLTYSGGIRVAQVWNGNPTDNGTTTIHNATYNGSAARQPDKRGVRWPRTPTTAPRGLRGLGPRSRHDEWAGSAFCADTPAHPLVEVPGIEPGSFGVLSGLLRAQLAVSLLGPTDHTSESVRRAQSLINLAVRPPRPGPVGQPSS